MRDLLSMTPHELRCALIDAEKRIDDVREWTSQRRAECRSALRTSKDKSTKIWANGWIEAINAMLRILNGSALAATDAAVAAGTEGK